MNRTLCFQLSCILFSLLFLISCKVKRPESIIPESTMENLLYDYHIAKTLGDDVNYNESYKKVLYIDAVFRKYGITQAEFDSSMVWYTRNTEVLAKVYENVTNRFKSKQASINKLIAIRDKKPLTSVAGDSVDVWAWKRLIELTSSPLNNTLTFVLPSDTNFKIRDSFVWTIDYNSNNLVDSTLALTMAMQIIYSNDSIISKEKKIYYSGLEQLSLTSDSLWKIREVKGFIYYPLSPAVHPILIDKISLMRYHSTDSINVDSLTQVVMEKVEEKHTVEPVKSAEQILNEVHESQRLNPDELNRRRTSTQRIIREEQMVVEEHIKEERRELRQKDRIQRLNQGRND